MTDSHPYSLFDLSQTSCSCDFEVKKTKIMGGCQLGRKVVPHDSKSDLPLARSYYSNKETLKTRCQSRVAKI